MANSLETKKPFSEVIKTSGYQKAIENSLGDAMKTKEFTTSMIALANGNEKLKSCKPMSLVMCGLKAYALGMTLDPNLQLAYAVPYGDEAQFQVGYKGLIELCGRSGEFKIINKFTAVEGDVIKKNILTGEIEIDFVPFGERAGKKEIGYGGYYELKDGTTKTVY